MVWPTVGIIIPNYNGASYLRDCLASLRADLTWERAVEPLRRFCLNRSVAHCHPFHPVRRNE